MFMKAGDLNPAISIDTNANLTGATSLTMKMRRFHTTTTVSKTMTVSGDPTLGVLTYQWVGTDTQTPGTYQIKAQATFAGNVETFPQRSYLELVILP